MKNDKKYIGTYYSEQELLGKIDNLKAEGYGEHDLYVVANDEDKVSMVRGRTDVELTSPEHTSWIDKFKSFLMGEEPVRGALSGMGFSDEDTSRYYAEAQKGGILLFADRDYDGGSVIGSDHHAGTANANLDLAGANTTYNDPNIRQRVGGEATTLERGTTGFDNAVNPLNGDRPLSDDRDSSILGGTGLGRDAELNRTARSDRNDSIDRDNGLLGGTGLGRDTIGRGLDHDHTADEKHLKLHEERLNVGKDTIKTGEVNVNKHVETEKQSLDIPVKRDEVFVERRPAGETATDGKAFKDGESLHIPITEEKVEVTKRPVVNEEIVVGKRQVEDTKHVQETLRHEEADIDRTGHAKTDKGLNTRGRLDHDRKF